MSHFAKIENSLVTSIIVAEQAFIDTLDGTWIQTSYNTRGGIHYGADGHPDGKPPLRANYAGVGFTYDATADVFYEPKPKPAALYELDIPSYQWKLKPEYTPLALVRTMSSATVVPTAPANTPMTVDGMSVPDLSLAFFPMAATNPGVYRYHQDLGLFAYQNRPIAAVKVESDDTQVWKFTAGAWVSQPVV
jgi:hypothetical protein